MTIGTNSKIKGKLIFTLLIFLLTFNSSSLFAQYKLDEKVSFVYINGKSTLHDWTSIAEKMSGKLKAEMDGDQIKKIDLAEIVVQVNSLKSGKDLLDKNMYQALKSEQFSEITYQLKNHVIQNGEMIVTGEITIAGVTRLIEAKVEHKPVGEHIKINGEVRLKMTDFNIEPPKFLFGSFKTDDEISIRFYFMFCKENASHFDN